LIINNLTIYKAVVTFAISSYKVNIAWFSCNVTMLMLTLTE